MMLFFAIYFIGFVGAFIHYYRSPKSQRTKARLAELLLLYQLVFGIGLTSLISFGALTFKDVFVADFMRWPTCPFQQELANVNLSFGILGVLCIWYRGLFWVATVLGFSIWIFSDGIHHLYNSLFKGYNADGQIDGILFTDLISPIVLMALLAFFLYNNKKVR